MLLYHVNVGWPVVDEGSELLVPATAVEPRGDHSVEGYRHHRTRPQRGYVEQVFEHEVAAEADGRVPVAVVNRRLGPRRPTRSSAATSCPTTSSGGCSARGPTWSGSSRARTAPPARLDARARGELIELAPGESRNYDLELGALSGRDEIDRFAERVEQLLP